MRNVIWFVVVALAVTLVSIPRADGSACSYAYNYGASVAYGGYSGYGGYGYSSPGYVESGWAYSPYWKPGYVYYYAQWYQGTYWYAGYYAYIKPLYFPQYIDRIVPAVFATYQPPAVIQAQPTTVLAPLAPVQPLVQVPVDPCAAKYQALQAELNQLRAMIAGGGGIPNPNSNPNAAPPNKMAVGGESPALVAHCASCHSGGTEKKLFDKGKRMAWDGDTILKATRKVLRGEMPPPDKKKLSNDEGQAVLGDLDKIKNGQ